MRAKSRIDEMNKELLKNLEELSKTPYLWNDASPENKKNRADLLRKIEYNLEVIKLIAENL